MKGPNNSRLFQAQIQTCNIPYLCSYVKIFLVLYSLLSPLLGPREVIPATNFPVFLLCFVRC